MSETIRNTVAGFLPAPYHKRRLVERRARERVLRQERRRKPDKPDDFVCYENSDSDDDTPFQQSQTLRTSYSFVDYICSRQSNFREPRTIGPDYAGRHILTHDMYKERPIVLGNCNKVFCSQWLSNRQVVFGTKCNKLMVYDVNMRRLDAIPTLSAGNSQQPESQNGIHSIQLNPSRSLLATGARHSADIAVYRLPTLDPVCVGSGGHRDWVMDMDWLDDQFLVSGSKDAKMALWRISEDVYDGQDDEVDAWAAEQRGRSGELAVASKSSAAATAAAAAAEEKKTAPAGPQFVNIQPVVVKECKAAQKIRSLCFNPDYKEIVVISLNGYIHLFNAETFSQVLSRKLPNCQDNVCIAHQPNGGLYAVGCRSYTLLLDPRTLQVVKKIASRYSGCGIRSASFQEQLLTVGTGLGMLMFYDVRAGKYLESAINASRTVVLKASKGCVFPEEEMDGFQQIKYVPAIYTHCYDSSGTRIFAAGGPLPATLVGNYAGIWQ